MISGTLLGHSFTVAKATTEQVILRIEMPPGGLREIALNLSKHPDKMLAAPAGGSREVYRVASGRFCGALGETSAAPGKATLILEPVAFAQMSDRQGLGLLVAFVMGTLGIFCGQARMVACGATIMHLIDVTT